MENLTELKFFIVDDDIFCSTMSNQCLINLNCTDITCFNNGKDCLNSLNQNPDIIFLDYYMNSVTGFEILNIYVVIVSSREDTKIALNAIKQGAYHYINKDSFICDKMAIIINKISEEKILLSKETPTVFNRIINVFK
jgi:DNA-binding NtrC family response regulator